MLTSGNPTKKSFVFMFGNPTEKGSCLFLVASSRKGSSLKSKVKVSKEMTMLIAAKTLVVDIVHVCFHVSKPDIEKVTVYVW